MGQYTIKQLKNLKESEDKVEFIEQYIEQGYLAREGTGAGTKYCLSKEYIKSSEIMDKALGIGLEELKKRGEIK